MRVLKDILSDTSFKEVTKPYNLFVDDAKGLIAIPHSYNTQWSAREVGIYGEHLHLYSRETLELINNIEVLDYSVNDVAFHPDLPILVIAIGSYDGGAYYEGSILTWDYEKNEVTKLINDNREFIKCEFLQKWKVVKIEVNPTDDLYEDDLKTECYEFDFNINTSYDLSELSLKSENAFEDSFDLEVFKTRNEKIISTLSQLSLDCGKQFKNRNLIWDIKFLSKNKIVIARNNSTVEIIDLDNNQVKEYILPKNGDCVEVFHLTSNDEIVYVNLWSRDWDSDNTNSLYEISLKSECVIHKDEFNHTLSKTKGDFFLARQIDHSNEKLKDFVLDKYLNEVFSDRLGHYDLFNHYIRIDNCDLLYFLVGSPKKQHQNKLICSIDPKTHKIKKVYQLEKQPSHYNNLSGLKIDNFIVISGSVYSSKRTSYGEIELFAIDTNSKKEVWHRRLNASVSSLSDLTNGMIALAMTDGTIETISLYDGKTINKIPLSLDNCNLKPLSMDFNGRFLAIGTTDGRVLINEIE